LNVDEDYSIELAVNNLKQQYKDHWRGQLFEDFRKNGCGNKLRTYRKFKLVYELEPYLEEVKNFKHRQAICQLRVSNHRLKIELGRYDKKPINERLCGTCNVVEDEELFLTKCSRYSIQREVMFKCYNDGCINFNNLNNEEKMIFMLSTAN
jgi:hypothetical protein